MIFLLVNTLSNTLKYQNLFLPENDGNNVN